MKDCLEEHRDEAEFSSDCKEEFEKMMEARATDYRLDSSLREKCAEDIEDLCGFQKVRLEYLLISCSRSCTMNTAWSTICSSSQKELLFLARRSLSSCPGLNIPSAGSNCKWNYGINCAKDVSLITLRF